MNLRCPSPFVIGWLVIATLAAVLEAIALVNRRRRDTLSEQLWSVLERGRLYRALLVMAWAWFTVHVFRRGFV